jgi:hypothetical protein
MFVKDLLTKPFVAYAPDGARSLTATVWVVRGQVKPAK